MTLLRPLAVIGLALRLLGGFTAQPTTTERGPDPNRMDDTVALRATRPLRFVSVALRTPGMPSPGVEVELPLGQDVAVRFGRRPRLSPAPSHGWMKQRGGWRRMHIPLPAPLGARVPRA